MTVSSSLHGVEHQYMATPAGEIQVLNASVIALAAVADDADAATFPIGVPTLVTSDKLIAKAGTQGTLAAALEDIYRQSRPLVVVVRCTKGADDTATLTNVVGGVSLENGTYTGIDAFAVAESIAGVRPRLILAPGFSHDPAVAAKLEAVGKKLRAIPIIDGNEGSLAAEGTACANYGEVIYCNPKVKVSGQARAMSATVAGHIARVDEEEGYWNSPSSRRVYGITALNKPVDHTDGDATSLSNLYSEKRISTIVWREGGPVFWGNRLANGTLIPHQRIRYMVGDAILKAHYELLSRNITKGYVQGVKNRVNSLIRRLVSRGVISGGECWIDKELNTPESIASDQFFWDYKLGFYNVAERMTFRQYTTNEYNQLIVS